MTSGGLRERKKQRTRETIQDHALRLYAEQGYAATTVEQIADAAEVSQSTFFRYFPTKQETVLFDRMDPLFAQALVNAPTELAPLAAARFAFRTVFEAIGADALELETTRMRLVTEVPELRTAVMGQIEGALPIFLDAISKRMGRRPDETDVLHWLGAVGGVVLIAFFRAASNSESLLDAVDEAIAYLEAGMPL